MRFIFPQDLMEGTLSDSSGLLLEEEGRMLPSNYIIKHEDLVKFCQSSKIIEEAKKKADEIIQQAHEDYQKECERGYQEGNERAALEQAGNILEQVSRSIDYFENIETKVVQVVMASIRKIIYDFNEDELAFSVIKNALSSVRSQQSVILKVHPDHVEYIRDNMKRLIADFPAMNFIDIVNDTRIRHNSCILESELGIVEVGLEEQLSAMQSIFEKVIGRKAVS